MTLNLDTTLSYLQKETRFTVTYSYNNIAIKQDKESGYLRILIKSYIIRAPYRHLDKKMRPMKLVLLEKTVRPSCPSLETANLQNLYAVSAAVRHNCLVPPY